jgi:hypothetical protein
MDFKLYMRVMWRFKLLVGVGFVLAVFLAALSMVKISSSGVTYRQSQLWETTTRLLVTQSGFPEGRLYAQRPVQPGQDTPSSADGTAPVADPGRFNTLALLYADLATSDPVLQLMEKSGPVDGKIDAISLRDDQSGYLLPLIDVTTIAATPGEAMSLAQRNARALNTYITQRQVQSHVPEADRAILQTILEPKHALLFRGRSKTMPIVVFLVVMLAITGLAFLLENARPRVREQREAGAELRRTA